MEDLLKIDCYKFILTARFQSDPIEMRFGQYRQMSEGRFLVSLKEVLCSEKIIKIKSILKEGLEIHEHKSLEIPNLCDFDQLDKTIDAILDDVDRICLNADHVAGYVAHKLQNHCKGCCEHLLIGGENAAARKYIPLLSRGGLKVPSDQLTEQLSITRICYIRCNFRNYV